MPQLVVLVLLRVVISVVHLVLVPSTFPPYAECVLAVSRRDYYYRDQASRTVPTSLSHLSQCHRSLSSDEHQTVDKY